MQATRMSGGHRSQRTRARLPSALLDATSPIQTATTGVHGMGEPRATDPLSQLRSLYCHLFGTFRRRAGSQTSISEAVADVHGVARFRWILRRTLASGVLVHVLFLALFVALDVHPLVVFNLGSILAYVLALLLLRRGHWVWPFVIAGVETIAHAFLATYYLGLSSGFFIYIPLVTVLGFLQPHMARRPKFVWGGITLVAFTGLIALGEWMTSGVRIAPLTDSALAIFNASAFVVSLAFLAFVAQEAAQSAERDLRLALARLDDLARTDALTGLLNRRAMSEQLEIEARRVDRTDRPFAVLVVDLDDFKGINDGYGHGVGDHVLRCVAQRLLGTVRAQDQVARWGGEEFLLLLPETDLPTALHVAERLRQAVAEPPVTLDDAEIRTTATFGVSVFVPGTTVHEAVRSADRALYQGKDGGKDRVVDGTGRAG